jgi:hypothetical protein
MSYRHKYSKIAVAYSLIYPCVSLVRIEQTKPVPEFIDPVFTKTSPKRSFSLNRKRAFWLVFAKTGSIISGTGVYGYVELTVMAKVVRPRRQKFGPELVFIYDLAH